VTPSFSYCTNLGDVTVTTTRGPTNVGCGRCVKCACRQAPILLFYLLRNIAMSISSAYNTQRRHFAFKSSVRSSGGCLSKPILR